MKKTIKCVVLLLSVFALSHQVHAGSYLVSAPLPRGENGNFVCTCTNISKKDITLEVIVKYGGVGGVGVPSNAVVSPGGILTVNTVHVTPPMVTYCEAAPFNSDTKSVTNKKVLCTFSAVDFNGSPQVTIPVNTKRTR